MVTVICIKKKKNQCPSVIVFSSKVMTIPLKKNILCKTIFFFHRHHLIKGVNYTYMYIQKNVYLYIDFETVYDT